MTLIEIMVVITILALISAAVGVAVIPVIDDSKRHLARQEVKRIVDGAVTFKIVTGHFPDPHGDPIGEMARRGGLDKVPVDPWGEPYKYLLEDGKPVVISYGADRAPGGTGLDEDIRSSDALIATRTK